jgi:hypothetical protein
MPYQNPIVLGSNLIPAGGLGSLPSGTYDSPEPEARTAVVTNEDGTITVPTYQLQSNEPEFDLEELQNVYGTKYLPMFRWISQNQTGETTFDPTEEIDRLANDFKAETGMSAEDAMREQYKQEAIGLGTQLAASLGGQVGRSVAANVGEGGFEFGDISEGFSDFGSNFKGMDLIRAPKYDNIDPLSSPAAKLQFSPDSVRGQIAKQKAIASQDGVTAEAKQAALAEVKKIETANPNSLGYGAGLKDRLDSGLFDGKSSAAGRANLYGAGGAGLFSIAANLIAGQSLKESVKTGAKVGVGTYVGTAIGGPIGGFIGGLLGGRVICNELMRQGIMTRKQVVLDYKFTEDYLTPQHVAGYHVWAVWMVRQMRKGRLVKFWTHVAGHRANEIAFIYGERDKPDYLGKVYRKILEPICWSIGFLCKKTDWAILYNEKEI